MKSEWRVTCNYIGGERFYGVYRLRDRTDVDHSGNRECVDDRILRALELADRIEALLKYDSKAKVSTTEA